MEELIEIIIMGEWELFRAVNGEDRVSCQNDREKFEIMRRAQYQAWPPEALRQYAAQLAIGVNAGQNILREKYTRMMRSTAPDEYEVLAAGLPAVSEEKAALVAQIWEHIAAQTERMRELYPFVALGGRALYAKDEKYGWASVETYQTSELLTYSEPTLRALLTHIEELEKQGVDFARLIQENTVRGLGYPDLATADKEMARQAGHEKGNS